MIMFMSKGQVTYIVNVLVIYFIRGTLYYHVYVKGASGIHSQCFSDILYKRFIILSWLCPRGKWLTLSWFL